jgi:hypothetical protein
MKKIKIRRISENHVEVIKASILNITQIPTWTKIKHDQFENVVSFLKQFEHITFFAKLRVYSTDSKYHKGDCSFINGHKRGKTRVYKGQKCFLLIINSGEIGYCTYLCCPMETTETNDYSTDGKTNLLTPTVDFY